MEHWQNRIRQAWIALHEHINDIDDVPPVHPCFKHGFEAALELLTDPAPTTQSSDFQQKLNEYADNH